MVRCGAGPHRTRVGQPRRRATSSLSVGSRGRARTGSAGRRRAGGGPRHGRERVVPGEPELVRAVVLVRHEIEQVQRFEGQEAVGDADRDVDPVVGVERRGSPRAGRRRVGREHRPDVDQGHERPAGGDDPVIELAAVEVQAAQDARRRGRQVGLDEVLARGRQARRPPQLAERPARVDGPRQRAAAGRRQAATTARSSTRDRAAEHGRVVGHGLRPRSHRLAARQRRRRRGRPSAAGVDARVQVLDGTCSSATATPMRAERRRGPFGAGGDAAVDEVVDAAMGVVGEQLDDRLGDVGRVGRRAPFVVDDPERLAGSRRPARRHPGSCAGSRARAGRTARPSGRCPGATRATAERLDRGALAGELGGAVRIGRAPARRRRRSPRPSVRSPSNTSLVETTTRSTPRAAQAAARTPVAVPLRRIASSGSRAQPSTSVQAAAWTTTSGRSRSRRAATPSGRVEVELRAGPGERPAGPGERRVREGVRPAPARAGRSAPVTATRISRRARRGAGWRRRCRGRPEARRPRTGARSRRPSRRTGSPATRPRWRRTSRPSRRGPSANDRSRLPAERRELRAVHRVAPVVAGPVLDLADERPRLAEPLEEQPRRSRGWSLDAARHVVGLAGARRGAGRTSMPAGVVVDVQPVAPLEAVAVERQRPVVDGVGDEQRDELLGVVVRAVRVGAAGHDGVQAVGHDVAPHEQLAGRLGGGVRRARRERVVLAGVALVDRAVDLVGRDLEEARPIAAAVRHASSRTWTPMTPVRRNASGSRMDRSTCDSAAKLTTASAVATSGPTTAGSAMSPWTNRRRAACSGSARTRREVRLVAGVGQLVEDGDRGPVAAGQHVADVGTTR